MAQTGRLSHFFPAKHHFPLFIAFANRKEGPPPLLPKPCLLTFAPAQQHSPSSSHHKDAHSACITVFESRSHTVKYQQL